MKKIICLITFLCAVITGQAQSFLGVRYGTPYEEALRYWKSKYHDNASSVGESIMIITPMVSGIVFDCAIAYTSMKDGRSVIDGGTMFLEKPLSEDKSQALLQKGLINLLKDKYGDDTQETTDDCGYPFLSFGKRVNPNNNWLGCCSIDVSTHENTCALILNYNKIYSKKTDDL